MANVPAVLAEVHRAATALWEGARRVPVVHYAGLAAVGMSPAAAADSGFVLQLDGNAAAAFTVRCTLEGPAHTETVEIAGRPPLTRHFQAERMSCEIRQTAEGGRLDIAVRGKSGNLSRFSTGGAGSAITVTTR
ncbi:hypothetical protein [Limimonas halophila]|uniref:hypothetical protein n=1 Tax=Limimonas halophila TaxID=1082479 RepID=UPI00115F84F4|nr:hypothetical protein [Limimonas halophila]